MNTCIKTTKKKGKDEGSLFPLYHEKNCDKNVPVLNLTSIPIRTSIIQYHYVCPILKLGSDVLWSFFVHRHAILAHFFSSLSHNLDNTHWPILIRKCIRTGQIYKVTYCVRYTLSNILFSKYLNRQSDSHVVSLILLSWDSTTRKGCIFARH